MSWHDVIKPNSTQEKQRSTLVVLILTSDMYMNAKFIGYLSVEESSQPQVPRVELQNYMVTASISPYL